MATKKASTTAKKKSEAAKVLASKSADTKKTTTRRSASKSASKTTTTRRTVSRRVAPRPAQTKAPVTETTAATTPEKRTANDLRASRIRRTYIAGILTILILGAFLYAFRSWFVAAVVNGQPISRLAVIKDAEKQSGKQALDTQVRNALIEQEAKKQHVTVTDKEINDEINNVQSSLAKQGQKLDQVLQAQGMTRDDLKKLIRLDKLVSKMVGKDVKVTDQQVNDYIAQNKDVLPQDQSADQLRKTVADRLKQQELNDKVRTWLDNLQKQAKVTYFVQY